MNAVRTIIIDGNNFSDMEGFYCETDRLLTKGLTWQTGHNMHAFRDILRGGFGVHEYGEPLLIKWLHYEKSRKELGDSAMLSIIDTILDRDDSGYEHRLELY